MNKNTARSTMYWLAQFVHTQLFVTLVSLPILIGWGLPISLLGMIGNLVFAPVLTSYLFLATLIFFCELVHLPNGMLITLLGWLTALLRMVLAWDVSNWSLHLARPHPLVLLLILTAALAIIQCRGLNTIGKRIAALSTLLLVSMGYLISRVPQRAEHIELPYQKRTLHVLHANGKSLLIDTGALAQSEASPAWLEYTALPELAKRFGSTAIDAVITTRPSSRIFAALAHLCRITHVDTIYLPCWEGSLSKNGWRMFFDLQRAAQETNTRIVRLGTKPVHHILANTTDIQVTSTAKRTRSVDITYPNYRICGTVNDIQIAIC